MRPFYLIIIGLLSTTTIAQSNSPANTNSNVKPAPTVTTDSGTSGENPCSLSSSAAGLEQQQEDLTRNITYLENRARSVNTAILSLNAVTQDLSTKSLSLDQYQNAARDAVQQLKTNTVYAKDIPAAVRNLTNAYRYSLEPLISLPGVADDSTLDPEVSTIVSRYLRTARDIYTKRNMQLGFDESSSSSSKATLLDFVNNMGTDSLKRDFSDLSQAATDATHALMTLQKTVNDSNDAARACRSQVIQKRDEEVFMNRLAIKYGLPWFCLTAGALFLVPQVIRAVVILRNPALMSQLGFSVDKIIELVTILFISLTILILGLASKIDGQVLGTLLGGISGYVLNRISRREGAQASSPPSTSIATPMTTSQTQDVVEEK
jgi:hypothetical protein